MNTCVETAGRPARGFPFTAAPFASIAFALVAGGFAVGALAQDESADVASPADTPQLKERDHDDLGKLIGEYIEARTKREGLFEARADLEKKMEAIAKRAKVDQILKLASDWEAAMRVSKKYHPSPSGKGRLKELSFDGFNGDSITYWVHGPKSYKNATPCPLLLVVPDKDQKLDEILRIDWIEKAVGIEDEVVLAITAMPSKVEDWLLLGTKGRPGGVDRILQVFKQITKEWNIDTERVFLCGHEDGVAAVVHVASLYPDRFAGVIGRSGDPQPVAVGNFMNLPVLLAAGSNNATAFDHAADERGWTHIDVRPSAETGEIFEWIKTQVRRAHPSEVRFEPIEQFSRDAYWIRAEGFEPEKSPWIHAVADRKANTIKIEGSGVSRVIVFYNDRILDLDRPVKVEIGGVVHEHTIERDLDFMLERARATGDAGRVYVGQRPFDFPLQASPAGESEGAEAGGE